MQDAKQDASGSPSGQGSLQIGHIGCFVETKQDRLTPEQVEKLKEAFVSSPSMALPLMPQPPVDKLVSTLQEMVGQWKALADSIARLAASNEALVQAMAEAEGVDPEDVPAKVGLNGRAL